MAAHAWRARGLTRAGATATMGLFAVLATLSLVQGLVDVLLPGARGEEPFAFLYGESRVLGPLFFCAYLYVHNLGLACIVPGYGFAAAWAEQRPMGRRTIAALLVGGVASALAMTLAQMLRDASRFNLRFAIPLYVGECASVLALALLAARELARFEPERTGYAGVAAMRVPLAVVGALLGLLASLETVFVFAVR